MYLLLSILSTLSLILSCMACFSWFNRWNSLFMMRVSFSINRLRATMSRVLELRTSKSIMSSSFSSFFSPPSAASFMSASPPAPFSSGFLSLSPWSSFLPSRSMSSRSSSVDILGGSIE